jgi:integrase
MARWSKAAEEQSQHRRALTEEEAKRLLAAAEAGETERGLTQRGAGLRRVGKDVPAEEIAWTLTGEDRAVLYRLAIETALRSSTLAKLRVIDFKLHGNEPTVRVPGKTGTKERAVREIPLRRETAAMLTKRFATKLPSAPAFAMPKLNRLAAILRADLEAARRAWIAEAPSPQAKAERAESDFLAASDAHGRRVDFHALRDTAATWLVRRGVPLATVALITGHRNIATLEKHYLRLTEQDARAAVDAMDVRALRMTGTDESVAVNGSVDRSVDRANPPQGEPRRAEEKPKTPLTQRETGSEEAAVGFEPTNRGFAIRSLGPLGHAAGVFGPSVGVDGATYCLEPSCGVKLATAWTPVSSVPVARNSGSSSASSPSSSITSLGKCSVIRRRCSLSVRM